MTPEYMNASLSPERRVAMGDVVLARELINKDFIEQQATDLIAAHELKVTLGPIVNEQHDNAVTGLFERITAAGDLSEVSFTGDQVEIHLATRQRILNSLVLDAPDWDKKRCYYELCEELTVAKTFELIQSGALPIDTKIITLSDYPDDPVSDQEKHDRGYRTLNKKGMLRSYHFERDQDGQWVRVLEQLSRSQSNDGSTRRWFNENAGVVPLSSTGTLAEQFLVSKSRLPDGVISLAKELDGVFGTSRLYGESGYEKSQAKRAHYDSVRTTSRIWREQLQQYTNELTTFEQYLHEQRAKGAISYDDHLRAFHQKIDGIIARILLLAPQFAEDTYGSYAAVYVHQASYAFASGNYAFATNVLQQAIQHKNEKASTACGGSGIKYIDDDPANPSGTQTENSQSDAQDAINSAVEDRKYWKWKEGVCVVKTCASRPGKTKVGPCSVCVNCQHVFDKGGDPTVNKAESVRGAKKETEAKLTIEGIARALRQQFVGV